MAQKLGKLWPIMENHNRIYTIRGSFGPAGVVCLVYYHTDDGPIVLARGVSICSVQDNFCYKTGKNMALGRAIKACVHGKSFFEVSDSPWRIASSKKITRKVNEKQFFPIAFKEEYLELPNAVKILTKKRPVILESIKADKKEDGTWVCKNIPTLYNVWYVIKTLQGSNDIDRIYKAHWKPKPTDLELLLITKQKRAA